MRKKDRTGEVHILKYGEKVTVLKCENNMNLTVQFEGGCIIEKVQAGQLLRKTLSNPYRPSKYGIGYIGVGKYVSEINDVSTIEYDKWNDIFRRCYNSSFQNKNPTYHGCSVDPEWHCFQNLGEWFEQNYNADYMQGWHLDKDILIKGNKVYSSKTCELVPQEINALFTKAKKIRGAYPIGVTKAKNGRFFAAISKNKVRLPLGYFDTPEEAFEAYKEAKEEWIREKANKWRGKITERCYWALMNYIVEITD